MSGDWLEARLGILYDNGTELELLGGTNFVGFVITKDLVNGRWDIALDPESITAPGDSGEVVYNSAGALAGADGVTIIDSATGLKATHFDGAGTVASAGTFRAANNVGGYTAATSGGSPVLVGGYIDGADAALYGRTTGPYVSPGHTAWYTNVSGSYYWRGHEDTEFMRLNVADGLVIAKINGAAPLAPVEGTVLADADANIVATDGSQIRIPVLTANRTYDINNTSAIDEETITLYRTGTEAFTATIRDAADATIATFPASTKLAGVFRKATGANFVFVGFQRIA